MAAEVGGAGGGGGVEGASGDADGGGAEGDGGAGAGVGGQALDPVGVVRAHIQDLLQLHPDGLLGSQIPVAYKAKYHTSWKEACHGAVSSLTDLLATSQFYRIVDTSGTINRFFAL